MLWFVRSSGTFKANLRNLVAYTFLLVIGDAASGEQRLRESVWL